MNVLVIVNDQPYGWEPPYNAVRLANALSKREDVELRVFLFGDAVACAIAGQKLPDGHYHSIACSRGFCTGRRSLAAVPASRPAGSRTSSSS